MVDKNTSLPSNTNAIGSKVFTKDTEIDVCAFLAENCPHIRNVTQNGCLVTFVNSAGVVTQIDLSLCQMPLPDICDWIDENCPKVESVSGECVDNSDPLNPVINLPKIFGKNVNYDAANKCFEITETPTQFSFDPLTCVLTFTNECGITQTFTLPQASFGWDGCNLIINQVKGQPPLIIPIKNSQLIPDYTSGIITHISGDGTVTNVDICQMVCTNCKPSLAFTLDGNGDQVGTFQDGCGGITTFDIPAANIHVGDFNVNGSVVMLTGENNNTVTFDICQIVNQNCPTSLNIDSNNCFTFIGTNGVPVTWCPDPHVNSNVVVQGDHYLFSQSDGTQALVCINPVKEIEVNGQSFFPDPSGKVTLPDYVTGVRCQLANGQFVDVPLNQGVAEIPYKPECIKCLLPDGTFLDVDFNAATGCYEIPSKFNFPTIIGQGDITVTQNGDNEFIISYTDEDTTLCCIEPDGSVTDLFPNAQGKIQIPFKDIPVVGSGDVTVSLINGQYVVDYEAPDFPAFPDFPVYLDKSGNAIADGSTLLQPSSFPSSGAPAPAGIEVLSFGPDGECLTYLFPEVPVVPDICCEEPDGSLTDLVALENKVLIPFKDVPVVGSGDVTVTLIDGEYVVSYEDAPASDICCVEPDGSLTDLEPIDNKIIIPFKDIPVVGTGDITVTLIDGEYVVDYTDDDATFVNGDDVTLVDNQGPSNDSYCVQEPLTDCAGDYIEKGSRVLQPEDITCSDGAVQICDICFNPTVWGRGAGATNFNYHVTSADGNGVVIGKVTVPFVMPKCGGRPYVEANVGATVEDEGVGGRKLFKWYVSMDGGAFTALQTTGSSAVVETGQGSSVGGEISVHSIIDRFPTNLTGGAHVACFELRTVGGTITGAGDIFFQSADARVLADGIICCDAEEG